MKARIKETGKCITVDTCDNGFYDVETHDIYEPDELDFAPSFDWAAYRMEAAKDILCAILRSNQTDDNNKPFHTFADLAKASVACADELIKQLKEK